MAQEEIGKEAVYEISILGRITWNLHSLSNEGTVGNVTEPRTLTLADGSKTDGISGEMLKHIHVETLWALENNKNNLCSACQVLKPERANACGEVTKEATLKAVKTALQCELCDLHGFLLERPVFARESTIEFGWAVGLPEIQRDIHVHARHSIVPIEDKKEKGKWDSEKCSVADCKKQPQESELFKVEGKWYCETHLPTAQMLYYRPTRSGVYAIVSVFQPWRIGLNDLTFEYEIENIDRERRYMLALKAFQAMFLRPEGAMTTTRLPHANNFTGIIVVSKSNYPAPVISPLHDAYVKEIQNIKGVLKNNKIEVISFSSLSEYTEKLEELMKKTTPWRLVTKSDE
jgi:CRISPR-associated protein Cst2